MSKQYGTIEEKFWARVEKTPGCWLWHGHHGKYGHGQLLIQWRPRKFAGAHRLSWELHFGPIPASLLVLHACDNGACVNPDHLLLGTQKANMVDASRKGRTAGFPRQTHCDRGHRLIGENVYITPSDGGRSCLACIRQRDKDRWAKDKLLPRVSRDAANRLGEAMG